MRRHGLLKIFAFLGFLVGLIYASQQFITSKNYLSYALSLALRPVSVAVKAVVMDSAPGKSALSLENERLKAQILALAKSSYQSTFNGNKYISAKIYSTYPFNNRGLITVNAGSRQGVIKGAPVTLDGAILVGQVQEVFESFSVVRTFFDAGWEVPVKISKDNKDALLVSGKEPRLTLIAKEIDVQGGDSVYAASKDFDFGMTIGEVKDIYNDKGALFREASISFPYDLGDITEIAILIR